MENQVERILSKVLPFFVFAIPLLFIPLTPNYFEFNKVFVILWGSLAVLAAVLIRNIVTKKAVFYTTPLDLPVLLFLVAFLLSTFISSTNRLLPLWGRTGMMFGLTLFYLALVQTGNNTRTFLHALFASSFALSWITIFAYVQLLGKFLPWDYIKSQLFTPAGSLIALVTFQVVILPAVVVFGLKTNQFLNKLLYFLVGALGLISVVLAISLMLPGKPGQITFLPYQYGWWISVDTFKSLKSALFGVGPESFLTAFTRFKPAIYNLTQIWGLRFTNSSNEIMQILTTVGLVGLASFIYMIFKSAKTLVQNLKKDDFNLALKLSLAVNVLTMIVLPANFLSFFTLYILVALIAKQIYTKKEFDSSQILKITSGAGVALMLAVVYFSGRVWAAEAAFNRALVAAAANKGLETYNGQMDAIRLNPFQEKYRVSFAQVNLALANALAGKQDLGDQDRQNITQLVSQAISEAKAAAALDPSNPIYWENMATIYRALINFANGSDQWAVASYTQAIRLDPANPSLRVDLGGLYYALGDFDSSIDQFKRAADLKPDLANAYYNLSWSYRQKKDYIPAYQAMQQVIGLVTQDSTDFVKASQELVELRDLLPPEVLNATGSAQTQQQLTQPPALPSTPPTGPIDLPQEAGPGVSPEPAQSPAPSESPAQP